MHIEGDINSRKVRACTVIARFEDVIVRIYCRLTIWTSRNSQMVHLVKKQVFFILRILP